MEDINLRHELTLLLEKEVGFTGKFILDKQCRSLDIDPDKICSSDLDGLARKISWAIKSYTGEKRAEEIRKDILDYRKALDIVDRAVVASQEPEDLLEAQLTLAVNKLTVGMLDEALEVLATARESLESMNKKDARSYEVRISRLTARSLARYGNRMDEAMEEYERAISLGKGTGQHYDMALSRAGLGAIFWRFGEHKKSLKNYELALEEVAQYKAESGNDKKKKKAAEALIKSGLGNVYLDLLDYDSAIRYNEDAIEIFKSLDNGAEVGRVYNNLARVYEDMEKFSRAIDTYERAIKYTRESGELRMEGWALTNLASTLMEAGKNREAREHLDRAEKILRDFEDPITHSKLNCMWGKYHRQRGEWSNSIERFQKSLGYLENLQSPDYLAITREEFGIMYLKKGDADRAKELLDMALIWYEAKGEAKRIEKIRNLLKDAGIAQPVTKKTDAPAES